MNNVYVQGPEYESAMADSVTSTPRSERNQLSMDNNTTPQRRVRFMCSFGGKILPRPLDNQLRYVGGDTRIIAVDRQSNFTSLLSKLSKLYGTSDMSIKYQLPNEDLDALITVSSNEDVENMMEEYDRLVQNNQKSARLRLFLFTNDSASNRAASFSSAKREQWFLDALNAGSMSGLSLDRGRSEVSSVISEMPDYIFGLDQSSDDPHRENKLKVNKNLVDESVSASDPGSPAPSHVNVLSDLPPIKTKPDNPITDLPAKESPVEEVVGRTEPLILNQIEYTGNPDWNYPDPVMQHVPVYYVPSQMQPIPIQAPFVQPYPLQPGQVPVGFAPQIPAGVRQVYGGPGHAPIIRPIPNGFGNSPMYFGMRNAGLVPPYPNVMVSGGEELPGSETDSNRGWVSQAP